MQPRGASQLDPGLGFGGVDPSFETRSQGNLVAVLLASEIVNDFGSLLSHLNQQNIIKNQQNNVAVQTRIGDDRYMDATTTTETTMTKKSKREWTTTKSGKRVWIRTVTVGQCFGTVGQVMSGSHVLAETETRPYGFASSARAAALALTATL